MEQVYNTLSDFQKDYHFDFSDPKTHLGEGSYGEVVKAFDKNNNTWVALKRSKSSNTDLQKEFDAAKDLNHPNIAKYQSCYRLSDPNVGIREYAIIKLYECNLNHIIENVKLANSQTHELVKSILLGLEYLHNNKKIHRDFKPGNILISTLPNGNYTAHITDFGLTKIVGRDDLIDGSDVMLSDGRGTASYKAPEQVEGEKAYYNMDLWAFGVILFELLTRERPFKRATIGTDKQRDNELFRQIKNVAIPNSINQISEPYQSIIRRCLVKDIHKRVRKESELLVLLSKEINRNEQDFTDLNKDRVDAFPDKIEVVLASTLGVNNFKNQKPSDKLLFYTKIPENIGKNIRGDSELYIENYEKSKKNKSFISKVLNTFFTSVFDSYFVGDSGFAYYSLNNKCDKITSSIQPTNFNRIEGLTSEIFDHYHKATQSSNPSYTHTIKDISIYLKDNTKSFISVRYNKENIIDFQEKRIQFLDFLEKKFIDFIYPKYDIELQTTNQVTFKTVKGSSIILNSSFIKFKKITIKNSDLHYFYTDEELTFSSNKNNKGRFFDFHGESFSIKKSHIINNELFYSFLKKIYGIENV